MKYPWTSQMRISGLLGLAFAVCLLGFAGTASIIAQNGERKVAAQGPSRSSTGPFFERGTIPLRDYLRFLPKLLGGEDSDTPQAAVEAETFLPPRSTERYSIFRRDRRSRARAFLIPYVTGPPLV